MTFRTALLIAAAAASLAACASKPKAPVALPAPQPAPAVEAPPPAPPPAPITEAQLTAQQDLAAKAGDRVFFALDSHDLTGEARDILGRQAQWLAARTDVRVRVEGNADERGTREYNLALGARRAASVRAFLMARGVSASRVETVSYGKERPIDLGASEDAWSRNRNAHTAVIP